MAIEHTGAKSAEAIGFAYIMQDEEITELAGVRHRDFYRTQLQWMLIVSTRRL